MNGANLKQRLRIVYRAEAEKKPAVSVGHVEGLRDGTTGRAVLAKVWAVGETAATLRPLALVEPVEAQWRPRPELAFYRKYTEAMLQRYLRMSMAAGRVPSLLGRELFRAKVTSYTVTSFEDVVIFCLDVERCLGKLEKREQEVVKRIGLQDYTQGEAAGLLGLSLRETIRRYGAAMDRLTGFFLEAGMMERQGVAGRE